MSLYQPKISASAKEYTGQLDKVIADLEGNQSKSIQGNSNSNDQVNRYRTTINNIQEISAQAVNDLINIKDQAILHAQNREIFRSKTAPIFTIAQLTTACSKNAEQMWIAVATADHKMKMCLHAIGLPVRYPFEHAMQINWPNSEQVLRDHFKSNSTTLNDTGENISAVVDFTCDLFRTQVDTLIGQIKLANLTIDQRFKEALKKTKVNEGLVQSVNILKGAINQSLLGNCSNYFREVGSVFLNSNDRNFSNFIKQVVEAFDLKKSQINAQANDIMNKMYLVNYEQSYLD